MVVREGEAERPRLAYMRLSIRAPAGNTERAGMMDALADSAGQTC